MGWLLRVALAGGLLAVGYLLGRQRTLAEPVREELRRARERGDGPQRIERRPKTSPAEGGAER